MLLVNCVGFLWFRISEKLFQQFLRACCWRKSVKTKALYFSISKFRRNDILLLIENRNKSVVLVQDGLAFCFIFPFRTVTVSSASSKTEGLKTLKIFQTSIMINIRKASAFDLTHCFPKCQPAEVRLLCIWDMLLLSIRGWALKGFLASFFPFSFQSCWLQLFFHWNCCWKKQVIKNSVNRTRGTKRCWMTSCLQWYRKW